MRTIAVALVAFSAGRAAAETRVCLPSGTAGIQQCLDGANQGDVIEFAPGLYTLEAGPRPTLVNRGGLTLKAQSTKSPPLFQCAVGANGRPSPQDSSNSAFVVRVTDGTSLPALRFEQLGFRDCATAILVVPAAPLGGTFSDVQVRGVEIDNAIAGIVLQGVVRATLEDNEVRRTENAMFVFGAAPRAQEVRVLRNRLRGPCADLPDGTSCEDVPIYSANIGVQTVNVQEGLVSRNDVTGYGRSFPVGVTPHVGGRALVHGDLAAGPFHLDFTHNDVSSNQVGFGLGGGAGLGQATGEVACNKIRDEARMGIAMVQFANGWTIHHNNFKDNAWEDILLLGILGSSVANHGDQSIFQPGGRPTHDNLLIVRPHTVVQDEGIDNIVRLADEDDDGCGDGEED